MNSAAGRSLPTPVVVLATAFIGAVLASVLGLLTFGVQATVNPDHVPLAVGADDASSAPALSQVTQNIAAHGGNAVEWHTVHSRAEAQSLLDNKQVYGALLFAPASGGLTATILVSGALNPTATAAAESVLINVAQATKAPVQIVTVHPTSAAGRTLPLAATALLWLAALAANIAALVLGPRLRKGVPLGRVAVAGVAAAAALLGTAVVVGFAWLWDSSLPIGTEVAGFIFLVGLAFALLQAGILRWLGPAGVALLGPLYLMAPAVAGLPPELINPIYRALLWSWTPFRFSAEGLRSVLFLGTGAPDVQPAILLFALIALGGLVLIAARRKSPAD